MRISDWSSDGCSSDLQEIAKIIVRAIRELQQLRLRRRPPVGVPWEVDLALLHPPLDRSCACPLVLGRRHRVDRRVDLLFVHPLAQERAERLRDPCVFSSEERRGGKESGSECRSGWGQY